MKPNEFKLKIGSSAPPLSKQLEDSGLVYLGDLCFMQSLFHAINVLYMTELITRGEAKKVCERLAKRILDKARGG